MMLSDGSELTPMKYIYFRHIKTRPMVVFLYWVAFRNFSPFHKSAHLDAWQLFS